MAEVGKCSGESRGNHELSSTPHRLTPNGKLLDLPQSAGEYVIVHQLVHSLTPNHGKVLKIIEYRRI